MSCKLEPAIWSHDTGQQLPYFDRCQLIITWMSDIKEVHGKPRLHVSVNLLMEYGPMLRDSTAVVVVVRTRPRAIPLAMVHMRNQFMGSLQFPNMGMGLRLAALGRRSSAIKVTSVNYFAGLAELSVCLSVCLNVCLCVYRWLV